MDAMDRINAALALPHTHEIVWAYADGREGRFTTRNESSAENFAVGIRRKIGRDLMDRDTGQTVRYTSVVVRPIK